MKLLIDHTRGFGKMEREVLLYYPFGAMFEKHEYEQAISNGWFPLNKDIWFQSRSTRLDLSMYKPSKSVLKNAQKISWHATVPRERILRPIYEKYIAHKGFTRAGLTTQDIIDNSNRCLLYTYESKPVAFLCYKIIGKAFLAVEFAWDYANPDLTIGHVSRYAESKLARIAGCTHIYMSAGYEKCSIYKSSYPGFEWWTGHGWTNDVDKYKQLCYLDSQVAVSGFDHR